MKRLLIMASIATLLAGAWPSHAQPQGPGGGRRGMDQPMRPDAAAAARSDAAGQLPRRSRRAGSAQRAVN